MSIEKSPAINKNKNAKRPIEVHIVSTWEYLTISREIEKTWEYMKELETLEWNWKKFRDSKETLMLHY